MAMVLAVRYPGGEQALATGYPVPGTTLVVDTVPRGPEAAYLDVVEVDFSGGEPYPVTRVVAGPRRPTIHIELDLVQPDLECWLCAREDEGWELREADDNPGEVWLVAHETRTVAELERVGARILSRRD